MVAAAQYYQDNSEMTLIIYIGMWFLQKCASEKAFESTCVNHQNNTQISPI